MFCVLQIDYFIFTERPSLSLHIFGKFIVSSRGGCTLNLKFILGLFTQVRFCCVFYCDIIIMLSTSIGCDTVSRVVASDSKSPQFVSSPWHFLQHNNFEKDVNIQGAFNYIFKCLSECYVS